LTDVGKIEASPAGKQNPYTALQLQVCGCGTVESRLLFAMAMAGPCIFLVFGLLSGLHGALVALLVLLPTTAVGVTLGLGRRGSWPALDVMWWLNRHSAANWRRQVGGSMPRNEAGARSWLESHPDGTVPDWARATVMILAGRLASAHRTISAMPVGNARDRRLRLELELVLAARAGLPIDTTAVDAAIREDADEPAEDAAAHLAYHAALAEVDAGRTGIPPLLAVRASLGRLPSDLTRRLWLVRFRYAAASFATGVWLLVTVVVGLATSGGVVWF
jgi:hypothetical protein